MLLRCDRGPRRFARRSQLAAPRDGGADSADAPADGDPAESNAAPRFVVAPPGESASRSDLKPYFAWLGSAATHLLCLLVIGLLLVPLGDQNARQFLLELTLEELEEETVELQTIEIASQAHNELTQPEEVGFEELIEQTEIVVLDPLASGAAGRPAGPHGAERGRQAGGDGAGTQFFGTVAYGNRFVYVLDVSNSMDKGSGESVSEGTRYERASAELVRSVKLLNADQTFYVVLFSSSTRQMFDDQGAPQMARATPENKQRLEKWLKTIKPNGGTDPREALRVGLEMYPSAMFLLSDGEFQVRRSAKLGGALAGRNNVDVPEVVAACNASLAPIHTVAFEDRSSLLNMSTLSAQTGGEFRFVPPHAEPAADEQASSPAVAKKAPKPIDPETHAASSLTLAKKLAAAGKLGAALRWLRRVVERYPQTDAADEAQQLIDEWSAAADE